MTTSTPDREQTAEDGFRHDDRRHLDGPCIGRPGSTSDLPDPSEPSRQHLGEIVGPFVAWLATQNLDEALRRRHRDAVERFLRWSDTDGRAPEGRFREHYENHLRLSDPDRLLDARAGLDLWMDHRLILSLTQLVER